MPWVRAAWTRRGKLRGFAERFAKARKYTLRMILSFGSTSDGSMPGLLLALLFPGEIRSYVVSRWAPLHWVMGIASYGLFGAAVLHAAMLNRADRQMRQAPLKGGAAAAPMGLPLLRLERLTFRFVAAGFI